MSYVNYSNSKLNRQIWRRGALFGFNAFHGRGANDHAREVIDRRKFRGGQYHWLSAVRRMEKRTHAKSVVNSLLSFVFPGFFKDIINTARNVLVQFKAVQAWRCKLFKNSVDSGDGKHIKILFL